MAILTATYEKVVRVFDGYQSNLGTVLITVLQLRNYQKLPKCYRECDC